MKMRRIVTGQNAAVDQIYIKQSSGSLLETRFGETVQPSLIKIADEDAWKFYEGNDWILSVVNRIVNDTVKVTPTVVLKEESIKPSRRQKERMKTIRRFFEDPNKNKESFYEIRQKVIRDMLVYGRGCIEKVNTAGGNLIEIYAQCPKDIRINADEHGNIVDNNAYVLTDPILKKQKVRWDKNEMIFMVFIPISSSLYGIKIMDAIANTVAADILRGAYNSAFFINNAEASGVLSVEGMGKTEMKKFSDEWKANHKGVKKSHRMSVVNVPVQYVRMALTNRDMEFLEYGRELRTKILAAYNVPPFIMGIVDQSTGRLNSGQQIEIYKDGAIRPILEREKYYYTKEIIEEGFGFTDLTIKFTSVDLTDIAAQSKIDQIDADRGIITINEIRSRRGLPGVPWGDTPVNILPGGNQIDSSGAMRSPSNKPNKPKKPAKKSFIEKWGESVKIKLESCHDFLVNLSSKDLFDNYQCESVRIYDGRKNHYLDKLVPIGQDQVLNSELWKCLEEVLDCKSFSKDENVLKLLDCVKSQLMRIIISNHKVKNLQNIYGEIDNVIGSFKKLKLSRRLNRQWLR